MGKPFTFDVDGAQYEVEGEDENDALNALTSMLDSQPKGPQPAPPSLFEQQAGQSLLKPAPFAGMSTPPQMQTSLEAPDFAAADAASQRVEAREGVRQFKQRQATADVDAQYAKQAHREARTGFGGFEQNLKDVQAENEAPLPADAPWYSKGMHAAQSVLGGAANLATMGAFGGAVDQLTAMKRSFIDPKVEADQADALAFYEQHIADKMSSTADFHARSLGKLFLGAEAYQTRQAAEKARQFANSLEGTLGTQGAGFYQSLLHSIGDGPLMLIGSATLAARATKALGAIPGAVAYGAGENAVASLGTPGSNLKTDLLFGGAIGGGVAGVAKGAQKTQDLFDFRPEASAGVAGAFRETDPIAFKPAEVSPGDKTPVLDKTPAGIAPTEGLALAAVPGDKLNDTALMFKSRPLGRPKQAMVYVASQGPDGAVQYTKIGPDEAGNLVQQPYDGLPSKIDAPLLETTDGRALRSRGGWSADLTDKAQRDAFENWRNERRLLDATGQDAELTKAKDGSLLPPAPLKIEDGNLVEVSEGSQVILVDSNKKVSMVRSYSHEGRRAIARLSPIVEVQLPDGSRKWGKLADSDGAPNGARVVAPLDGPHPSGISDLLVTTEASILRRTNELDPSSPAFMRTGDMDTFIDGFMLMSPEGHLADVPSKHPLHNRRIALDNPEYAPDGTLVGGKVRILNRAGGAEATSVDFYWKRGMKKGPEASMTLTFEGYKGRGLANAAYDYIEKLTGATMYPSEIRLEGGYALWEKRNAQRAKNGLLPLEPHHNIVPDPHGVDLFADHSAPPPQSPPPPSEPPGGGGPIPPSDPSGGPGYRIPPRGEMRQRLSNVLGSAQPLPGPGLTGQQGKLFPSMEPPTHGGEWDPRGPQAEMALPGENPQGAFPLSAGVPDRSLPDNRLIESRPPPPAQGAFDFPVGSPNRGLPDNRLIEPRPPLPPPGPRPEEVGTGLARLPNHDAKKRVFDAVSRMVQPDFARGPFDLANEAVNNRAAKSIQDTAPAIVKKYRKQLGEGLTRDGLVAADKAVKDLMDGTISSADFAKLHPQLAQRAEEMVNDWRRKVAGLRQRIAELGGYVNTADSAAMQDTLRRLKHERSSVFYRDLAPHRNAEFVAKDGALMDRAMREVMDQLPEKMPQGHKRAEAQRLINEFIGNPNNGASVLQNFRMRWLQKNPSKGALRSGKTDVRVELDILREALEANPGPPDLRREAAQRILDKADREAVDAAKALTTDAYFYGLPEPVQAAVRHVANTDPLTSTLRKLLGETEMGTLAMGHEVANLTGDIARLEMWQRVSQNPEWVPPPQVLETPGFQQAVANGEFELVPDNLRHEVGDLAGKYVRRDVWETLRVLPDEQGRMLGIMQGVLRYFRFNKTVGNPATWVTNLLGNMSGFYMSGLTPSTAARGVVDSYRGWREYAKNPLAENLFADVHRNFIKHSLADSDLAKGTLGMTDRSLFNAVDDEMRRRGRALSPMDAMETVFDAAHVALRKAGSAARLSGAAYGALDVWPKAIAYWGSLERAGFSLDAGAAKSLDTAAFDPQKATKFLLEQGATDIPTDPRVLRQMALNEAARNVMSSFQMFNRLPKGQRFLGGAADILSGGFATSAAELMRIWMTWPQRALANPHARAHHSANMMKWGAVGASAYGALVAARHAAGIDDETLEDAKARLPATDKAFHNGAVATPIRDAKGDPQWIDVSDMVFWPAQLMQGVEGVGLMPGQFNPAQAAGMILGNAATSLVGGESFQRLLASFGMGPAPFQDSRMSTGDMLMRSGAVPLALPNLFKGLQEAGMVGGRPSTLGEPPGPAVGAMKAFLGGRVMTPMSSEGPNRRAAQYEFNRAMDEARRLQSGRARQGLGDMLFPRNPEQIRQEARDKRDKGNQ